ncbi:MAG: hypothetical protein IKG99_08250 [Bacteroidaceae bacterium]|nr:hypothetical protein [Bacteroidaceae bacterium]
MNIKQFTIVAMASCALLISCKKKEVTPEQIEISTMDYSRRVCPRMINENMTMDSIVFRADAPNDYYYYYTVSGTMDDDYEFPILIDAQRSIYLTSLKQAPEMIPVKELEATVHHVFISKNTGKVIYDLQFVSAEYNGDYVTNAPHAPKSKAKKRRRKTKKK